MSNPLPTNDPACSFERRDPAPGLTAETCTGAIVSNSEAVECLSDVVTIPVEQESRTLLQGPIRSGVFFLALPVLGEQLLNAAVTWNDALIAGRISAEATNAIGIAGYISWLMTMLFWMADTGATAIVARATGARNSAEVRHAANQAFSLAVAMGIAGTLFVLATATGFASLLNMHGYAAAISIRFMRIDALGLTGAAISLALAACLRGAGDTRTPLVVLGGVNLINITLTWLLALGWGPIPAYGVDGIAWGTVAARWCGAVWMITLLARSGAPREALTSPAVVARRAARAMMLLRPAFMRFDPQMIRRILKIGVPAAGDGLVTFSGHFVFMMIVTRVPSEFPVAILYAAHIVGIRIESLSYLPANAYGVAAAALVGQNLGANQPDRAAQAAREAARQAACLLALNGLLFFFAAEPLFRILSDEPRVWACGVPALRGLACVQIPLAFLIVYVGALRGAGDSRSPMIFTALSMALVRVPLAYLGGIVLQGGLLGAWMGMFGDIIVRAVLMSLRFRLGRWKRILV